MQQIEDREVWQIVTIWSGMADLQQIQRAKEAGITPRGALMFREAGAESVHTVFDVVQQLPPR